MSDPGFDPAKVLSVIDALRPLIERAKYHFEDCPDVDLGRCADDARDALADLDPTGLAEQNVRRATLGGPA